MLRVSRRSLCKKKLSVCSSAKKILDDPEDAYQQGHFSNQFFYYYISKFKYTFSYQLKNYFTLQLKLLLNLIPLKHLHHSPFTYT